MKNLLLYFCLSIIFLTNLDSLAQAKKKAYSKVDFFKNGKSLTTGYKFFSRNKAPGYGYIPKLSYDKKGIDMCEIICLPENLKAWQATVLKIKDSLKLLRKGYQDREIISPMILNIESDPAAQKKHKIYAFYTPEQNVILESDLQNKVRRPGLPSSREMQEIGCC